MNIIKELNESSDEAHYFGLSSTVSLVIAFGLTLYIHSNQITFSFWPLFTFTVLSIIPVLIHVLGECKSNIVAIVIGVCWGALLSPILAVLTQNLSIAG